MKRFVLDPGTLIAGVACPAEVGETLHFLQEAFDGNYQAVACPRLLEEFRRGLTHEYFGKRFEGGSLREIVAGVEAAVVEEDNPTKVEAILRDPDDDYLVALAREAGAEAIVTGDRNLLDHPGLEPPAIDVHRACELLAPAR